MDINKLEKAGGLLSDLQELKRYRSFDNNSEIGGTKLWHFEYKKEYSSSSSIMIPSRYNDIFIQILEEIIHEIEAEIENI